jgi:hypothetical protein
MRLKTTATSLLAIGALSVCAISAQQPTTPSPMPTGLARVALGAKQRYDNIKRDIADSCRRRPGKRAFPPPTPRFGRLAN